MLQQLINHSPDIKKLSEQGYDLELNGAHLLVHHIPYLNAKLEVSYGTIVTVLTLVGPHKTAQPPDHTVFFVGETPFDAQGNPLIAIINNSVSQRLTPTILVNHYFSSKPITGKYPDYYEKIRTYAEILTSQALVIDSSVTCKPLRIREQKSDESVFKYPDTNAARAEIEFLSQKFTNQRVAIIGLGGTGSYILDLVAKTPVQEIHIYDGDTFQLHNAFRAPGAIAGEKLQETDQLMKVDYFSEIYSRMHKGIMAHREFVTTENINSLSGFDFVFISVDSNAARHFLTTHLLQLGVPFIDVGLGVNIVNESLIGSLRVTVGGRSKNDHLSGRIGQEDHQDNEYAKNIQIADLNSLNATLAVIKWKKIVGYYQDLKREHNILYFINTDKLMNDDFAI